MVCRLNLRFRATLLKPVGSLAISAERSGGNGCEGYSSVERGGSVATAGLGVEAGVSTLNWNCT